MGTRELVRDVLERPVSRLVPHIGYVSLFPFMGKIIPSVSFTFHGTLVTEKNCFTSFFGSHVFASLQLGVAMPLLCSFFFSLSVELIVVFLIYFLMQDSWILEKQLDLIANSTVFWTDYGLRSLSKTR